MLIVDVQLPMMRRGFMHTIKGRGSSPPELVRLPQGGDLSDQVIDELLSLLLGGIGSAHALWHQQLIPPSSCLAWTLQCEGLGQVRVCRRLHHAL